MASTRTSRSSAKQRALEDDDILLSFEAKGVVAIEAMECSDSTTEGLSESNKPPISTQKTVASSQHISLPNLPIARKRDYSNDSHLTHSEKPKLAPIARDTLPKLNTSQPTADLHHFFYFYYQSGMAMCMCCRSGAGGCPRREGIFPNDTAVLRRHMQLGHLHEYLTWAASCNFDSMLPSDQEARAARQKATKESQQRNS